MRLAVTPTRSLRRHARKGDGLLRVLVVQCHAIRPVEHIRVRGSGRLWLRPLLPLIATVPFWIGWICNTRNTTPWIWNKVPSGLRRPVCDRKVDGVGCDELVGATLRRLRASILRHCHLHILTVRLNRNGIGTALKDTAPLADQAALRGWRRLWPWCPLRHWCPLWPL